MIADKYGRFLFLCGLLLILLLSSCRQANTQSTVENNNSTETIINEPIQPIPLTISLDKEKVTLGKSLFFDPQLSTDNTVSCASCHELSLGGADFGAAVSVGVANRSGEVNAPTVFNSGFNFKQFWDGRADTLESQIDGPTHTEFEMNSNWGEIVGKLSVSEPYQTQFAAIYPDGITSDNIKDAIAEFERSLYTPNSRFDQYLRGNLSAITEDEKAGYQLFKNYGCVSCHQGVNVGGNMFQQFGVMADYFTDRGNITEADYGRYNVTGIESDRHLFKVPSLRLAALTPPYFHDGEAATLADAIAIMGRYQLGRELSTEEIILIEAFLQTLPGEYEGQSLLPIE